MATEALHRKYWRGPQAMNCDECKQSIQMGELRSYISGRTASNRSVSFCSSPCADTFESQGLTLLWAEFVPAIEHTEESNDADK